jgi:predicted nuclease of predicted toxin-antitoxin system
MTRFLVDENLPYYFELWDNDRFTHVYDLDTIKTDTEIWDYAKENDLIIISKDTDFSNKIMYKSPPPKVIHIRFGNVKIQKLFELLTTMWNDIEKEIEDHKLVNVFIDRIESIS